jgi:hypothetical protein
MNLQEYINKEVEKFEEIWFDKDGYEREGNIYEASKSFLRTSLTNLAKYQVEEIEKRLPKKESERFGEPLSYVRGKAVGHNNCLSEVRGIIKL